MTHLDHSTNDTIKLDPLCLKGFRIAYSATGFILPCCWADNAIVSDFAELMTENLKLDNNIDIEDIVLSDEWIRFYDKLKENSNDVPRTCKYYCGLNWSKKDATHG